MTSHAIPSVSSALIVFLIVLATRLPFLGPGYGVDADGWRVVESGAHFMTNGEYVHSRMPGYPMQEVIGALVAGKPYWVGNLATAIVAAVASVIFLMILRHYGIKQAPMVAVSMSFVPIVYIESVGMMDYVYALACLLGSTYSLLKNRVIVSGVLMGLAVGFRANSAMMLLPLVAYLLIADGQGARGVRGRLLCTAQFLGACLFVILLAYSVPLFQYGTRLVESYPPFSRPLVTTLGLATLGVFGIPGTIAVGAALLFAVSRHLMWGATNGARLAGNREDHVLWFAAVLTTFAVFLKFPAEAAYMIPAVPFVLLSIAACGNAIVLRLVCAAVLLSPFVGQFTPKVGHLMPAMPSYQLKRASEIAAIEGLWAQLSDSRSATLVITGSAYDHKVRMLAPESGLDRVKFVTWATENQIMAERARGVDVVCFLEACEWNLDRTGADPIALGGRRFAGAAGEEGRALVPPIGDKSELD